MNHPKPEEWVPYIYGEVSGEAGRELSAHLQACGQCQEEIAAWKRSLRRLDAWRLPRTEQRRVGSVIPLLRWAAAAVIVLSAGILIGRLTAPKVDAEELRQTIIPEVRRQMSAELTQFAREEAARIASLTLASGRRYTDQVAQQLYLALKQDVDTVAVNADAGLRNTAQQLVQLADYRTPQVPTNPRP